MAGAKREDGIVNLALGLLMQLDEPEIRALCLNQFQSSDNMTDRMAALRTLAQWDCPERRTALEAFERDPDTDAVLLIGEIGGPQEVEAARWARENMSKPLVAYIAGVSAPPGRRMGHAGAIISGAEDTARAKMARMAELGAHVLALWRTVAVVCFVLGITRPEVSIGAGLGAFVGGFLLWTLVEYILHRVIFHKRPTTPLGVKFHFLAHGIHHKDPWDKTRLVFPILGAVGLALLLFGIFNLLAPLGLALMLMSGLLVGYRNWNEIETATLSFGYGMSATPLQLAQAYAVLASGGILRPATFLRQEAVPAGERIVPAWVAQQVNGMLEEVTGAQGTALTARVAGYPPQMLDELGAQRIAPERLDQLPRGSLHASMRESLHREDPAQQPQAIHYRD